MATVLDHPGPGELRPTRLCLETNWSPSLAALNESDIQRKGLGRLHHAALGSATKG